MHGIVPLRSEHFNRLATRAYNFAAISAGDCQILFGLPSQAVGAIVAAIIAGIVALLGLIISKEQKVSEFRQQWIDALREDVAAVIAHSHGIHGSAATSNTTGNSLWDRVRGDITGISQASARIYLRLNPNEKNKKEKTANTAVLEALNEYDAIFASPTPDVLRLREVSDKLLQAAQIVLKINWDRVRFGERVYRIAQWVALFVIVGLAVVGLAAALVHTC
jgi:hypothetical protein